MTTGNYANRKPRGKGKKAAMVHTNIRLPEEVFEFYMRYPNFSSKVREVLSQYKETTEAQDPQT